MCYSFINKTRMLQRTAFINKIRMLQRKRRDIIYCGNFDYSFHYGKTVYAFQMYMYIYKGSID